MPSRAKVRWFVGAAAALAVAAGAAWIFLERVPEGSLGVASDRTVGAGIHVSPPWASLRLVPASGRLEVRGIPVRAGGGGQVSFDVTAEYHLADELAPRLASDVGREGLTAAAARLAGEILSKAASGTDAESLASDPVSLEPPLAAGYAAAGIGLARLAIRPEMTDRGTLARRTEEAKALARPQRSRLLVVGLDGVDWRIFEPLMASGDLPNLSRLVREGAWGNLRSFDPMFSPMLWTTMATGKTPDRHGIADFLVKDPATGERRPITSDFRRTKALWNVLTDLGRPSGWVGWWATYPAERVAGAIVSEMLGHAIVHGTPAEAAGKPGIAWPEGYLEARKSLLVGPQAVRIEDVRRLFRVTEPEFRAAQERAPRDFPEENSKAPPDPTVFAVKLLAATRTYANLAVDMLQSGLPVVSIYVEAPDMICHRFMHYMPPRMTLASDEEFARFRDTVASFYRMQDEILGEMLRAAGEDTNVVILSDHGFHSGESRPRDVPPFTTGQPAEWHRPWGVLLLHGPSVRRGHLPPATLFDVAPTLLYLAGLPLAGDMQGRLLEEAIRPEILRAEPPRRIRSYELVGAPLERREAAALDREAMAEMVENLRALGYVGGDGEGPPAAGAPAAGDDGKALETQVFYHRNLATFHMKRGDYRAAESDLIEANRRKPFPKTYGMLGEVRAAQGRFADAAAAIEEGLSTIGDQLEAESVLWGVEMHLKAGDAAGAARMAERWDAKLDEGLRLAIRGRLKDAGGDPASAMEMYEAALATKPLLVHVALRLHALYRDRGEQDRIEPVLLRGLAVSPRADAYVNLLGEIAQARGDFPAAVARFRQAVDIQPENGTYLGNLAVALAATGQADEARRTISWALRSGPKEPEAWLALGSASDRLGDVDRALDAFRRAREAGAPGPAADLGIVLVLARAGRMADARTALADARKRHPESRALADLARRLGS